MYYDSKNKRILLRDGRSLVDSYEYARMIIEEKDVSCFNVLSDDHSNKFEIMEGKCISSDIEDVRPLPEEKDDSYHINDLIEAIEQSPRYDHSEEQIYRIDQELGFFVENGHVEFVWRSYELVQRFKEDGVVWGVGRGSSCASLVMYLLEVNDINPLLFNIPFSEFSKEQELQYG